MIGFRVNAFRHQLAIDYNPTVANVVQLVRLIQAECEAASITSEGAGEKRARTAALQTPKDPPASKSVPTPRRPRRPRWQLSVRKRVGERIRGLVKERAVKGRSNCAINSQTPRGAGTEMHASSNMIVLERVKRVSA